MINNQSLITLSEAVIHLSGKGYPVTAGLIRQWAKKGRIASTKIGARYFFTVTDLEAIITVNEIQ